VFRAIFDTVQPPVHKAGVDVFFVNPGGSLNASFLTAQPWGVTLQPITLGVPYPGLSVDEMARIAVNRRSERPLPPALLTINGVDDATTTSLEGSGTNETFAIDLVTTRRDFRTSDEIEKLTTDAADLISDFPSHFNTQMTVSIYDDPLMSNTFLYSLATAAGPSFTILRDDVLRWNGGVLPTQLGISIDVQHTVGAETLHSTYPLVKIVDITSTLTGQFEFGAFDESGTGQTSATYTATVTGNHAFTLYTALTSGVVQRSVNGGAYATLISTATTVNLSLTAGDTVVLRHTDTTAGQERFLSMNAPGAGQDGFALIFKS
jgi:hypothetical protein